MFSKYYKEHYKGFVFKYCSFLYLKCEERNNLTVSNCLRKSYVFHRTKIHETVLKQQIRIEYLIKQKSRGALTGKQERTRWSHRKGRSLPLSVSISFGNSNGNKPPLAGPCCRTEQGGYHYCLERNSKILRKFLLILEQLQ